MNIRHFVHSVYKGGVEKLTGVPTTSTFEEERTLTPVEFERAGNYLVTAFPAWQWSAGDAKKAKPHLPKDKQFLIVRRVPSRRRANEYGDSCEVKGLAGEQDDGGEEWVTAEFVGGASTSGVEGAEAEVASASEGEDDAAVPANVAPPGQRHYDLHITWDKYYRVPRFWLVGFSQDKALSMREVYEDVSADHAGDTITWDRHPNLGIMAASIHPCKHASTMKTLGDMLVAERGEFSVEHYLLLFLKFIQSIIPTIEYDYTMQG
ncbi:hypothetical protein BSKO_02929 [Bryopsis sp. KO-2023]|nr:hypothetical protein BSKO_02929 [Bryopsis sp. KO-2023]